MTAVNHTRAVRIVEVMEDLRILIHQSMSLSTRVTYPPADQNEEGYLVLRRCMMEANAVLSDGFNISALTPQGDEEIEKTQLRQYVK